MANRRQLALDIVLWVFALFLASALSSANAVPTEKQRKLAELLDLMRLDQAYAISRKGCIDATLKGAFSPAKVAEKDGQYYGFTRASPAWPEVLEAFERYAVASCSPMTLAETKKRYTEFYGSRVSERDLDSLIRFLRSATGRAFVTVQDEFLRALGGEAQRRSVAAAARAQPILERDLARLQQRTR